ncbi:hypothetical protein EK21DRAFT_106533 [Setomelanomma holmii]|uniref:GPI anchored cell wall protein n=1 Tax=Setomelanomma holmii TaxID=210430 RepID=A0A9P4HKH1_9PLEO|nr:hypothetical protein EK21DRAFT_106533 [Setomelanomma holmii]
MKTASLATATALLSLSSAATVTLETTPCLDPSIPTQQLTIEMNLSGPVARDLNQVCGLRILSASDGVDVNTIHCQAFKDVVGIDPGSAPFTYEHPARISTNPVKEMAIRCSTQSSYIRRQNNDTASLGATPGATPVGSLGSTVTLPVSVSSGVSSGVSSAASQTTILTTTLASSGLPSSSGNASTATLTRTPTVSQTSATPSQSSGAASVVGVGMGVVAAGFLAMLV